MASAMRKTQGFSLVELAIVLVIIGLITGGILTGQELIRASELNSVASDYNKFKTAINTFKLKYNQLPGDLNNAQSYWGVNAGCAAGTAGTGTQTCNGNGDGTITTNNPGSITAAQEQFLTWQHLANAGLIPGTYNGISSTAYSCMTTGTNCPMGRVTGITYLITNLQGTGGAPGTNGWWWADGGTTSSFIAGANDCSGYPGCPIFTPVETSSLDVKYDDGKPGLGTWRTFGAAIYSSGCAVNSSTGSALTLAEGTKALAGNAIYALSNNGTKVCALEIFLK